jgi:hypothetical protein
LIVGVHPSGDDYRQKGQPHFSAPDFWWNMFKPMCSIRRSAILRLLEQAFRTTKRWKTKWVDSVESPAFILGISSYFVTECLNLNLSWNYVLKSLVKNVKL